MTARAIKFAAIAAGSSCVDSTRAVLLPVKTWPGLAKALLDTRKSRKPAVEELWFPINDQQEGSGAVDLVQQLEYAEVMGHDEL